VLVVTPGADALDDAVAIGQQGCNVELLVKESLGISDSPREWRSGPGGRLNLD
jgi:hypothetical protein